MENVLFNCNLHITNEIFLTASACWNRRMKNWHEAGSTADTGYLKGNFTC
jgi:hypothetical protein